MDTDGDAEREAALRAIRGRQRPPGRSSGPPPTSETDPVGVLVVAVLGLVALAVIGALLVGSEHVVIAFLVWIGMLVCGLVALVAAVAAGVEWGMRRSRG